MAPKRASTAAAGRASKVAKKDTVASKCKEIADALELAGKAVPAEVITLLGSVLKHALPVYKEERHAFQAQVLDMVQKTLGDAEEALKANAAAAEELVNNGDAERARRETAVTETEAALAAAVEAHKQKHEAKADAVNAFKATQEPLKEALAKQKEGDAEAMETEKAAAALKSAIADCLAPLKEKGGAGNKRMLNALVKQLTAVELEDSLLTAVELPLLKTAENRGKFDAVILEQLDLALAEKQAAFQAKLDAAAPAREERAAAVKAAQDAHDAAKAASEAAAEVLKEAKDAEAAAKAAAAAAKDSAKNFTTEQLDAAESLDTARKALQDFHEGALASFKELLERSAPAPEPEPVAEATEEAPAATE